MIKGHTIQSIIEGLRKKEFSAREIYDHYIVKIGLENKKLNAYLRTLTFAEDNGQEGVLSGVPAGLKDNILIKDTIATAGSRILENYVSAYDSTVAIKLRKAGVQFLGKTNMDEFAMGSSTENSAYGPTRNPHDLERVPGGSSGGSVAAVAADLCVFALGSDTGGSIRQPSSFCGVVGLKPTYGRVSRHGLIAMASSLDQIGPITKNVYDSALVMNSIAGHDKYDSTTVDREVPDYTANLDKPIKGLRVGIPKEFFGEGLSSEVRQRVDEAISRLRNLGCEIVEVSLPNSEYAIAAYYVIVPCEVSSNLARFDGIRYGYSTKDSKSLLDVYIDSRSDGLGDEPKRRILLGTYALSAGYYDAYYLKAQKVRNLICRDFDNAFRRVDVLVSPVAPTTAFKIGEKSSDPLSLYLADIYTIPSNLAGLPAISVPCGAGAESNLPVGLQIIGKSFDEETILRVAHQFEKSLSL